MHGFADAIRVQGCTLGQCTRNLSGWQHHWTIWQGAPTKETKTKGDGSGNSTINDDVATELKKVQSLARSLQGQHDRNQNFMDRMQRGRFYCHAIHLAELVHVCFCDNPQGHLCSRDLCSEEWQDACDDPDEDPSSLPSRL